MPDQPTIALPLDLPDVRVLRTTVTTDRELIIAVESTLTTTTCRRCGQTISAFYGYDRPIQLRLCCVHRDPTEALPLPLL